jgi:ATP-dependent DNA helicase RecG
MTPGELRARILRWEDPHTDFKESVSSSMELAKDLVCFANSDGGQLVIGVANDRTLIGVDDTDSLMLKVDDVAYHSCSPPVTVVPETVILDGKQIVVLNIAKGDQRPYATRSGQYYIRSGSRCRSASREELLRLFQASQAFFYDEQPLTRLDLADLDLKAVESYVVAAGREEPEENLYRLLRAWRLADADHPTVAGVLFFGRHPQDAIESSRVVVGAVRGTDTGGDFFDRKDIVGAFSDVIESVEGFLALHLRTEHTIRGFEPERREEIPSAALREAVINAFVHRDYTIPGPTRIFVLDDRVEVHSPGRPPNSVDVEAMRAGVHITRNPHIYSRVADLSLATRAGTGIRRISRLLREHSDRELDIQISDAEVVLILPRDTNFDRN